MKNADNVETRQSDIQTETAKQRNACFICNDVSHLKAECPKRSKVQNKTGYRKSKFQPGFVKEKRKFRPLSKFEIRILVENQSLIAYRDTGSDRSGSDRSFVQAQLFPNVVITGKIDIFGINDEDPISVPTAMVTVKSPLLGDGVV